MDQHGQNLNRYYLNPDPHLQPSIYASKSLLDYYASIGKLALYLDFHAHASKRGCFIYGNVMGSLEDQIQNQMFCRLIALNSPHFDYDGYVYMYVYMYVCMFLHTIKVCTMYYVLLSLMFVSNVFCYFRVFSKPTLH